MFCFRVGTINIHRTKTRPFKPGASIFYFFSRRFSALLGQFLIAPSFYGTYKAPPPCETANFSLSSFTRTRQETSNVLLIKKWMFCHKMNAVMIMMPIMVVVVIIMSNGYSPFPFLCFVECWSRREIKALHYRQARRAWGAWERRSIWHGGTWSASGSKNNFPYQQALRSHLHCSAATRAPDFTYHGRLDSCL